MGTYQIQHNGIGEDSHVYGRNSGQAKYNYFLRVSDCFEGFSDFLKSIKSVKKVPHVKGAYDFIQRQYGVKFEVGQHVVVSGEGSATGRTVEVIHPNGEGSYVNVILDGNICFFHPMSLTPSPDKEVTQ